MHTETSTTTATRPTAAEPQLIGAGERKGLHYELHMHGPTAFSFRVTRWNPGASPSGLGGFSVLLHESKPEYPHRGRVELAAERWIDAHAIEEVPETEAPPPAPANEPATKITVAGWLLQLGDDKGGTYKVELVDATTGEVHEDAGEFKGYMSRDQALTEAQQWAQENPLRLTGEANGCSWTVYRNSPLAVEPAPGWSFDVSYPTGAGDRGTFEGALLYPRPERALDAARGWCERFRIGAELPGERPCDLSGGAVAKAIDADSVEAVRTHLTVHHDPEGISAHVWLGEEIEVCIKGRLPDFDNDGHHDDDALLDLAAAHLHALGFRATMPHSEGRRLITSAAGRQRAGYEMTAPSPAAPVPTPAAPVAAPTPATGEPPRGADWDTVDEVWTLLQQRDELSEQLALLRVRKKKLAGEEKELVEMINEKDLEIRFARQKVTGAQRALPLHQAPRPETPAAPAPMSQPQLAAAAEKAAHEIEGPEVPWAFNGVDHTILVREVGPGSWRAALRGHEDRTEAFDPDRAAAIEACRQRASIVFEDAEPGSTAIPDPPKKTRGRKKKEAGEEQPPPAEEAADAPRVIAALRLSMNLDEAAKKLKISTKTLQKWAAENGVTLSEHLGVELGKDEPAPATKKPRGGRKPK